MDGLQGVLAGSLHDLSPIGPNNYFKSGEYRMAFPGEGTIDGAAIWAGGPAAVRSGTTDPQRTM